jgi:rod shape-determining protein MreC
VLIGLVVVSLILLTVYFGESAGSPLHSVQRGVLAVLSPVQDGASRALKPARDLFGWVGDTFHAKKERDQLRAQRDQLLRQQIDDQQLIEQNRSLSAIAHLDGNNGLDQYHKVTGRIIVRSPNNLLRDTMNVNVGSGAGVAVGDAVIGGSRDLAGLVGHVSTVTSDASVVTLITDQESAVGARILNNRGNGPIGLLKASVGDPLDLLVQQLPQRANVSVGDNVVTSGIIDRRFPSPYPAGIPIGRVRSVDPAELASKNQVHISPFADLRHLDFVQILTTAPADVAARAQVP